MTGSDTFGKKAAPEAGFGEGRLARAFLEEADFLAQTRIKTPFISFSFREGLQNFRHYVLPRRALIDASNPPPLHKPHRVKAVTQF